MATPMNPTPIYYGPPSSVYPPGNGTGSYSKVSQGRLYTTQAQGQAQPYPTGGRGSGGNRGRGRGRGRGTSPATPRAAVEPYYPPPVPPVPEEPPVEQKSKEWTPEQKAYANANAETLFDQPLNEKGDRRVRITTYGGTIGIDIRECMIGKFGELEGQWLPAKKGLRLRPAEWEALKAVSGDIDRALAAAQAPPLPLALTGTPTMNVDG